MDGEIQRVRGTVDQLPPEAGQLERLRSRLRSFFELYGYRLVSTPALENLDLFLRKSGEDIASRMYGFTHWNRKLCLRPEATASVMRAFVNHMQAKALPLRLQYAGPSFRYEKPQRGRYRQFTEVGVECIGAGGPAADAEVLYLACAALVEAGLSDFKLVVGHLGAALELLRQIGMDEHSQALVLTQMERLTRRQAKPEQVLTQLVSLMTASPDGSLASSASEDPDQADPLPFLVQRFGAERAAEVAHNLLQRTSLSLEGGSRTADEIVQRLLRKASQPDPTPRVEAALQFILQLHALAGPPAATFPALAQLLQERGLDPSPVNQLQESLELCAAHGALPPEVEVNLSLGRGLRYYTGLVFEIYHESEEGPLQVCGGGRYDELVRALGGKESVPACGFSIGLERLKLALGSALPAADEGAQVLVAPLEAADQPAAVGLAQNLRAGGIRVELDIRLRGGRGNVRYADRQGVPVVIFVGQREREAGTAVIRHMAARSEREVPQGQLLEATRGLLRG